MISRRIRRIYLSIVIPLLAGCGQAVVGSVGVAAQIPPAMKEAGPLRPPSVPLVACDPYFCGWSPADRLTDAWPVHWTGKRNTMQSMVRIDGKTWRLMGPEPADTPAMPQESVVVLPTRTIYEFRSDQVAVTLAFMTPAIPEDLDALSRPVTYLTWEVRPLDGRDHAVSVYFDVSGELAVNTPDQKVVWSQQDMAGLKVLRIGSEEQRVLGRKGDDLRIDWGYLYAATEARKGLHAVVASAEKARAAFAAGTPETARPDGHMPRAAGDNMPVMAFAIDLGVIGSRGISRHLTLAYDDIYSINYFGQKLRPYWRRDGADAAALLKTSEREYARLTRACTAFDEALVADAVSVGGAKYARICALAYRQCLAANKVAADTNGQPLLFPKENFSNGCIATVDVIYPMAPQFLLFSPALAKASIANIMEYAVSPRWKFPFAPHDLGQYPLATGQVYGGGERTEENQMPVEESGNMLLLLGAIARIDGNADFAARYWPVVTKWAQYLRDKGLDPENQLCTDDFAGHLAHNVNLSAKAILGLGAYAMLCDMQGKKVEAAEYHKLAKEYATSWVAKADDGDHFRLAFDKPGTWSQKYNLVWDRLLGLHLFPESVAKKEMAFYLTKQNKYGLPLDSRKTYTKTDWTLWTATLTGSRSDFDALVERVYASLNDSPSRVPMTDWYETTDAKQVGFQARSVVGGVFLKMLDDPAMWKKWASRGERVKGDWAPLPMPPKMQALVPTAEAQPVLWRFTIQAPPDNWTRPDFNESAFSEGPAGFGTKETPGAIVRTEWKTGDIWLRRAFELKGTPSAIQLRVHHDEDAEIYLNGVLAARLSGYTSGYEEAEINPQALATLKVGRNVMAVHCHQTGGGQYIDVGIVEPQK